MQQEKPDLVVSDLVERPPRKLILNVSDVSAGNLTLLEALDVADASGFDSDDFVAVLERGKLRDKARLLYAFAWVVARRIERDLTFDEVCTYQLEVNGTVSAQQSERERKKADTVVAVASLAKVSPAEAEQMTLAEVAATVDLTKKRIAASRRKRAG